jgi:hypothetical protein
MAPATNRVGTAVELGRRRAVSGAVPACERALVDA